VKSFCVSKGKWFQKCFSIRRGNLKLY